MRSYRSVVACGLLFAALAGCSSQQPAARGPQARCIVCQHNADLACVDVTVDSKTPQYLYQGKSYYFCSEQCRDEFAKNPAKYLK